MTWHLFGAVLTGEAIASNNRGEVSGNISTLQKVIRRGELYSTVSAEAIRYAIRAHWSSQGHSVNRKIVDDVNSWTEPTFGKWEGFVDDDLFGFMDPKKDTTKRKGRFEITRAISIRPWTGDMVFSVASVGAQPKDNKNPMPYSAEVHATRYQYLFSLTPEHLADQTRTRLALDAIACLNGVAGNHSRYLYDFSPDAVVLRWTHDPAPRMIYCFEESEYGTLSADKLLSAIQSGDIDSSELIAGGQGLNGLQEQLRDLGVTIYPGVKEAFSQMQKRIDLALETK